MSKPDPKPITIVLRFIDEVGLLSSPKKDRVFGLGLIKLQDPGILHREITKYKSRTKFHEEFKFSDVSNFNIKFYKQLIDLYFSVEETYFSCNIFDKTKLIKNTNLKRDYQKDYNTQIAKLIAKSLDTSEYIVILADDISNPKSDNYEEYIKEKVKASTRRNALFGICRVESHAISAIQMVDVLLGTIAYGFKIKHNLIKSNRNNAKFKLLKYVQRKLNAVFIAESRDYLLRGNKRFCINEYKGRLKRTRSAL